MLFRLVVLLLILSGTAFAQEGSAEFTPRVYSARVSNLKVAYERVMGNKCGTPCLMPSDQRDDHALGLAAALALMLGEVPHKLHIVNNKCIGSCLAFIAMARNFVCIGPNARILLYRSSSDDVDPPMPEEVNAWVRSKLNITDLELVMGRKTYPVAREPERALAMPYADALLFFEPCSPTQIASSN